MRKDTVFWKNFPLATMGRVVLTKMVSLPRLLYFFITLPVVVDGATFREIDTILSEHVWSGAEGG